MGRSIIESMPAFEARDPYPLLEESSHTHLEAQRHACLVDQWLGFRIGAIEARLAVQGRCEKAPNTDGSKHSMKHHPAQQLWLGLDAQSLLTPYTEIRRLLYNLDPQPGELVIDLGAAYGRMGFVLDRYHPDVSFLGYEYVGERVREGQRCMRAHGLKNVSLEHVDLTATSFSPRVAQYYFIYDFGTVPAIEKALYDLRRLAKMRSFILIARGRNSRYLIDSKHVWLKPIDPRAGEARTTIYRSHLDAVHQVANLF